MKLAKENCSSNRKMGKVTSLLIDEMVNISIQQGSVGMKSVCLCSQWNRGSTDRRIEIKLGESEIKLTLQIQVRNETDSTERRVRD